MHGPVSLGTQLAELRFEFWNKIRLDVQYGRYILQHRFPNQVEEKHCYLTALNIIGKRFNLEKEWTKNSLWLELLPYDSTFDHDFCLNITAIDHILRNVGLSLEYWNTRTLYNQSQIDDIWKHCILFYKQV